jgi:hypothetical protein
LSEWNMKKNPLSYHPIQTIKWPNLTKCIHFPTSEL